MSDSTKFYVNNIGNIGGYTVMLPPLMTLKEIRLLNFSTDELCVENYGKCNFFTVRKIINAREICNTWGYTVALPMPQDNSAITKITTHICNISAQLSNRISYVR